MALVKRADLNMAYIDDLEYTFNLQFHFLDRPSHIISALAATAHDKVLKAVEKCQEEFDAAALWTFLFLLAWAALVVVFTFGL